MDGGIKVSVIVPVYNTEKYLRDCLDSAARQTLRDIEILCVDDCSTDGSAAILAAYAAEDPRFRLLRSDRNRGQANARNLGLRAAAGEYVYFMDSDDWLSRAGALEALYEQAEAARADGVCFDAETVYETPELRERMRGPERISEGLRAGVYGGEEYFRAFLAAPCRSVAVWRQFWRRPFLLEKKLFFQENTSPVEDLLFTFQAFLSAARIAYLPEPLYTYRLRDGSAMTSRFGKRRFLAYESCYLSALRFAEGLHPRTEALQTALFRYLTEIRQMLEQNLAELIRQGEDLNELPEDAGEDAFLLKLLLTERFPYLDRLPTPAEYRRLAEAETIVVYGAGKAGRDVCLLLEELGLRNYVVAVTSPPAGDTEVRAIADLTEYARGGAAILAVTERYRAEMEETLKRLGFRDPICFNDRAGREPQ